MVAISGNDCLRRLSEEFWYVVDIVEDAYTSSRYFIRSYG